MSKNNVVELAGRGKIHDELTDLIREEACKLIAQGLELEVSELLSRMTGRQDELGRAAVVRNVYQPTRDIQTGIGPVTVKVPKIRSRDGKAVSFQLIANLALIGQCQTPFSNGRPGNVAAQLLMRCRTKTSRHFVRRVSMTGRSSRSTR